MTSLSKRPDYVVGDDRQQMTGGQRGLGLTLCANMSA